MTFEGTADTSLNLSLHEGVEAFLNKEDDEIPEITEPNTVNIYTETCETSPLSNGKTCMRSAPQGLSDSMGFMLDTLWGKLMEEDAGCVKGAGFRWAKFPA